MQHIAAPSQPASATSAFSLSTSCCSCSADACTCREASSFACDRTSSKSIELVSRRKSAKRTLSLALLQFSWILQPPAPQACPATLAPGAGPVQLTPYMIASSLLMNSCCFANDSLPLLPAQPRFLASQSPAEALQMPQQRPGLQPRAAPGSN